MAPSNHTYAQYFDSATDPVPDGDYASAYTQYLPPGPPNRATIFAKVGAPLSKGVYIYLGSDNKVHLLHHLRRHATGNFGETASAYEGQTIAVRDERTAVGANYVSVEETLFSTITVNDVRPADQITAAIEADQSLQQMDVADPNNGPLHTVVTRHCQLVPHVYVGGLMLVAARHGGISPRWLWTAICVTAHYHPSHQPLFDWARVVVSNGVGAANTLRVDGAVEPAHVPLDTSLANERADMERACFPAPIAPTVDTQSITAILGAIRQDNASRAQAQDNAKAAERALKSSPIKRWGEVLTKKACRIAHKATPQELPQLLLDMAESGASQDHRNIMNHVGTPSANPGRQLLPYTAPVVSQAAAKAMGALQYGHQRDVLTGGALIPFAYCYSDHESAIEANRINDMLDQHASSHIRLSLGDVEQLDKGQATKMPKSWFQLRTTCVGYHRIQQVTMGDDHPVPATFQLFVLALDQSASMLEKRCKDNPLFCAQLLRHVQLATCEWVAHQEMTDQPLPPPDYQRISSDLFLGYWKPPDLPPSLQVAPKAQHQGAATAAMTSTVLPSANRAPAAPVITSERVLLDEAHKTSVYNPRYNLGAMVRTKSPGRNEDGTQYCLSYHCKGGCYSNCGRKQDHRLHSANETKQISDYLEEMSQTIPLLPARARTD